MDQADVMHFRPVGGGDNNPQAAASARAKIAALPDPYVQSAPISKEDLARDLKPVSPLTQDALTFDLPEVATPAADSKTDAKKTRKLPSKVHPILTAVATFAFLFVLFKSPIIVNQLNYLWAKPKAAAPAATASATQAVPPAPLLTIPKINVNAPVVYPTTTANSPNYDPELESGVVHYPNTALPGQAGNVVIFGHSSNDWWQPGNYKFVFVLLDKLVPGDTFTLNYQSRQYIYQVTSAEVVEPTAVGVLNPTADPQVTLITCTPPGTSWKRLIVHAKLASPPATTITTASNNPSSSNALPSNAPGVSESLSKLWNQIIGVFTHNSNQTEPTKTPTGLPSN